MNERLSILAQLCYDRGVNPSKGIYASFLRGIICGQMFLSNQTAIAMTKTLTTAYYHDKWESLLKELNNGTVPPPESTLPLTTWNPQPKTKPENSQQSEPNSLSPKQLAQILYGIARRDTFNNIGRITQTDAQEIGLTLEKTQELWNTQYPKFEAENRLNCLLIFWDGKTDLRSQRDLHKTVQPLEKNISQTEGDVVDDTYDETAPEVTET